MNIQKAPRAARASSRRDFLGTSCKAVAAVSAASAIAARSYAAEDNTIKVALVGCGGRGGGAAVNALSTKG
ncbi:MAG: twin-arginine translocation signal domain-containing protein, partial [Planctomycetota bacterium]